MRWILAGVVLGLLLLYPALLGILAAAVAAVVSKPVLVAFGLGLWARAHLPRIRGWAR
ncbi:hypothetical protein [Streptomyces lincolnensis]|uniref:hypothetical protein n=1 Tax=Streptomyces lincolnensis TaxID=1915 RepID=UPI0037D282FB